MDKWKNLTKTKKILYIVLICIAILVIYMIACSVTEFNQEKQLDSIILPNGFGDKSISHWGSNTPLYLIADYEEDSEISLTVEFGSELPEGSSKISDDQPFYQTRYGVCEIVELNGETYIVKVSKVLGERSSNFTLSCVDILSEFNNLNNAKIIDK